jgi:hypothetical protein
MDVEQYWFTRERRKDYPIVVRRGTYSNEGVPQFDYGPGEFKSGKFIKDMPHLAWTRAGEQLRRTNPSVLRQIHWGGPLLLRDNRYEDGEVYYNLRQRPNGGPSYDGHFMPVDDEADYSALSSLSNPWAEYAESTDSELDAWGTKAIAAVSPAKPHASVLTSLGELYRDGLPTVTGMQALRGKKLSDLGSEYLNIEFGIKPLLSDMRKVHRATVDAKKILAQYERDAGRWVRRRFEPAPELSAERIVERSGYGVVPSPSLHTKLYLEREGQRILHLEVSRRRWFSGAFSYHSSISKSDWNRLNDLIKRYNHLYGIVPTPSVVWNLTPWSWASDWITTMGDLLSNVSMFLTDGLVMKYGYVMEHSSTTKTYSNPGVVFNDGGHPVPYKGWQRYITESKLRRTATPYGFGLTEEEFSPRQWAILVALGLSKGSKVGW